MDTMASYVLRLSLQARIVTYMARSAGHSKMRSDDGEVSKSKEVKAGRAAKWVADCQPHFPHWDDVVDRELVS